MIFTIYFNRKTVGHFIIMLYNVSVTEMKRIDILCDRPDADLGGLLWKTFPGLNHRHLDICRVDRFRRVWALTSNTLSPVSTRKELGQSAIYIWPKAISCYQACFIPTSVDLQATCKSLWSTPCNDREMLYIEKPFKMTALSNIGESVNTVLNVFSFCAPHLRLVTLHLWRRKTLLL